MLSLFLERSRFGRSRQVANRASCVNTVIIEGTRCKVHLLWRWLVSAPSDGYRQHSPCMHRVWIAVDSGVPIRQQTGHHVACVARECTLWWIQTTLPVYAPCLERSRFWRCRHKANTASCSMGSSCVNPLLDMNKSPLCMHGVWRGVDSGVPVRNQTRHHVVCAARV